MKSVVLLAAFLTGLMVFKPAMAQEETGLIQEEPVMGKQVQPDVVAAKTVVLQTNQGDIEIKLMPQVAPQACENFVQLAQKGYYDGIIFHRVIKGFMIQGGDPTGTGSGGESVWGRSFGDEVSPDVTFNKPGLLAMANVGPNTNGSQFFITTAKTPWLNLRHTIFGEVISGYDVVEKIENTPTGGSDQPLSQQKIIKALVK